MNGSVGEAQTGKWSNIHAAGREGPQLNGGIRGATPGDVKAIEAFVGRGNHRNELHRKAESTYCCCATM
jgi:hypothetical protein